MNIQIIGVADSLKNKYGRKKIIKVITQFNFSERKYINVKI